MPQPPNAKAAVAESLPPCVYPLLLDSEYMQDGAAIEAPEDLGAGEAAEPPLDSAHTGSAVAACQLTQPSDAQSSAPNPSGSCQPSLTTDLPACVSPSAARGQTDEPQSRRVPIAGHAAKNQCKEVGNFNIFLEIGGRVLKCRICVARRGCFIRTLIARSLSVRVLS